MSTKPTGKPTRERSSNGGARIAVAAFAFLVTFAAVDVVGALLLELARGRIEAARASWAAGAAAFVLAVVLPIAIDLRITRAFQRIEAGARSTVAATLCGWNAAVLLAAVLVAPHATRAALVEHGAWLGRPFGSPAERGLARAASWAAQRIPNGDSVATAEATSATALPSSETLAPSGQAPTTAGEAPTAAKEVRSAANAPANETDVQRVFKQRVDTVAVVTSRQRLGADFASGMAKSLGIKSAYAFGSAFVVSEDGQLVTNHHVVDGAESLEIALHDGRKFAVVEILNIDKAHDLAHLKIEARTPAFATLASDAKIEVGMRGIAIGSPLGLEYSVTSGIVSALREMQGTSFLQMDTAVASGSSGGPLFDAEGDVCGVNTAHMTAGLNLAVHARHVRELLAREPRPRKLAAFVARARIKEIRVEGAEMSSIDRMNLQESLGLVTAIAEGCIEGVAPDARLIMEYNPSDIEHPLELLRALSPKIDSNLQSKALECMNKSAQLTGMSVGAALAGAFAEEIAAKKAVTVYAPISGLAAGAGDKRASDDRVLDLRFVLAPKTD